MVYHLLPEAEPFSEHFGGALSRWTANVLKHDSSAVVLAPWCDGTWDFEKGRARPLDSLRRYGQLIQLARDHVHPRWRSFLAKLSFRNLFSRAGSHDVVYVHNRPEFVAAIHAANPRRRFKLILHMHNSHLLHYPSEFAHCADLIAFCSTFLLQEAGEKIGNIPSVVIPNGADESSFFPAANLTVTAPYQVLFVGRLVPDKGVHVLVEAMRILQSRGSDASALIVGGAEFGTDRETSYIRELKSAASSNVRFSPYRSGRALAELFRGATLFCCPSVFKEPFGMVNVEAMACGLPIVASRTGGIPEVFREGGALLVTPDNAYELADALHMVLTNEAFRKRLIHEGRQSFRKNFTWDVVREKYHRVLELVSA